MLSFGNKCVMLPCFALEFGSQSDQRVSLQIAQFTIYKVCHRWGRGVVLAELAFLPWSIWSGPERMLEHVVRVDHRFDAGKAREVLAVDGSHVVAVGRL